MAKDNSLFYLERQLETAWRLASHHLKDLTTEECLWRPTGAGPHVRISEDGTWRADWPEHEGYSAGPPSIAWLTWHVTFWWAMVIDHSIGKGTLKREDVVWSGTADGAVPRIYALHDQWKTVLEEVRGSDLESTEHARWPFKDRPFGDIVSWVNLELTKNAAEIGYVRFLFAQRDR
jgi:hypothetical protein